MDDLRYWLGRLAYAWTQWICDEPLWAGMVLSGTLALILLGILGILAEIQQAREQKKADDERL